MVAFGSKLSGESAASKDVCVCERGLALNAYEGLAMFSFASMDVYSPCHLQRDSSSPER